jgi:hypothetical protein
MRRLGHAMERASAREAPREVCDAPVAAADNALAAAGSCAACCRPPRNWANGTRWGETPFEATRGDAAARGRPTLDPVVVPAPPPERGSRVLTRPARSRSRRSRPSSWSARRRSRCRAP